MTRIYETTGHAMSLELAKTTAYELNVDALDNEDGWSYKVAEIANGLAYVEVYDENGTRLGTL